MTEIAVYLSPQMILRHYLRVFLFRAGDSIRPGELGVRRERGGDRARGEGGGRRRRRIHQLRRVLHTSHLRWKRIEK